MLRGLFAFAVVVLPEQIIPQCAELVLIQTSDQAERLYRRDPALSVINLALASAFAYAMLDERKRLCAAPATLRGFYVNTGFHGVSFLISVTHSLSAFPSTARPQDASKL